jgi:adenylate cyclase
MIPKWRPTLQQVLAFGFVGLLLGLGLLYYLVLNGSEQTILQSSERYRALASREVSRQVTEYLQEAPAAVSDFEEQIRHGIVVPKDLDSDERALFSLLLANPNISEATLTYASRKGSGDYPASLDSSYSGQIAVLRSAQGGFVRKRTWYNGSNFISESDPLTANALSRPFVATAAIAATDPTRHPTFQAAVQSDLYGQLIWTDLHWSQIDDILPEEQRRVEVSVQKAIEAAPGQFAGVLRIGLMKAQIDGAVRQHITAPNETDPHLIFICDNEGRLITGFGNRNHVTISGDDLRIGTNEVPPVVARALREPVLERVGGAMPTAATSFQFNNKDYLCTFANLPQTQGWIVGIVVPRAFYLGQLLQIRKRVLCASLILTAVLAVAGGLFLRGTARAQSLVLQETARMNRFEFSPMQNSSRLRDVDEVLTGLERAKTAMRAMSKYVPVNLVRQLYRDGREPVLGGKACELSVLFTDIKGFASIAEALPPDRLAEILGRYLQEMAAVIHQEKGTIDKYIGDAVMAFWNAPEIVPAHELAVCRAALRCRDALRTLYNSPEWGKAPRFETRFGLHRCQASVGHFGAPDRFNYTAIGDGINLTSRLEGLNKYYGTTIIASETIYAAAKEQFKFRLLDRVAVQGKSQGITIYELVAEANSQEAQSQRLNYYEQAFALYQRADFTAALALLETHPEDLPSAVLAARCRDLKAHPPDDWNGVYVFDLK